MKKESPVPFDKLRERLHEKRTKNVYLSKPSYAIAITHNDIHIWLAALDQPTATIAALARTLSADEHERAHRFIFPKHQRHFTVARGILRDILGAYTGQEPGQVQLCYGSNGKPCLATLNDDNNNGETIHFNLSHSQDYAVYAIRKGCRVGVDFEYIRPVAHLEHIVARFFTAREQADFHALAPEQRLYAFFNGWTRKEAYLKACGHGLANELNGVDVSIHPDQPAALRTTHNNTSPTDWHVDHLAPMPGYVGAVVWEGEYADIGSFVWGHLL